MLYKKIKLILNQIIAILKKNITYTLNVYNINMDQYETKK